MSARTKADLQGMVRGTQPSGSTPPEIASPSDILEDLIDSAVLKPDGGPTALTGAKAGNVALTNLITILVGRGIITDSTT